MTTTHTAPYRHAPLPTPAEIAAHLARWVKEPTSFELAEREQAEKLTAARA